VVANSTYLGAILGINRYDEYGIPASTNTARFQYTGQTWLPELGLYYYKARLYSPTLGRFLQTDPVGYQGGINLYGYVADDPINVSDPQGTSAQRGCGSLLPQDSASCSGGTLLGRTIKTERRPLERSRSFGLVRRIGSTLPAPARPSQDRILVDAAERAANSIPPFFQSAVGRSVFAWLRGILIHREFAANVRALASPSYNAEVSYLRGQLVPYGTPGSVRVDAVVGPIGHPLFAIELKTGGGYISNGEASAYRANLPPGALLQQILVP
jgi:RHS repeat-associated protein